MGTPSSTSTPPVFNSRNAVESSAISRKVIFAILAGPCVGRQVGSPGVIVVADQHGFLADREALQLEGAGADGFGDAEIVAERLVGFRLGTPMNELARL